MKNIRLLCAAILIAPQISHAATFTVTTTNDSGAGSLRQAILDANTNAAVDTIAFSIGSGVKTITPATALPAVTNAVVIDGTTQPGFAGTPLIEVNGAFAGANGLVITAGNSTVRGLVINNFGDAIILGGGGTNVISGNFIGTDVGGTTAKANSRRGIWVTDSAKNVIGGTTASARNVISGNGFNGVEIFGLSSISNVVQGNYIGVNASGTAALANNGDGVLIQDFAANNTIGGTTGGARNVISGNNVNGIEIASAGNFVQGNYIGTDVTGTAGLGNLRSGVRVITSVNTIGGAAAGAGNVISGNLTDGITMIGGSANANLVQGNFIGTDSSGTAALPNAVDGVSISSSSSTNVIGGTTASARNIISGNNANGIHLSDANSTDNAILGNYIGLAGNGSNFLGNLSSGVLVERAPNTVVGGTVAGARNVISGNSGHGIYVYGSEASRAMIQGNYVGPDAGGTLAIGNGGQGIRIEAGLATVGGADVAARNVVSGNLSDGILLIGTNAANCLVAGNYVGTRADGSPGFAGNGGGVAITVGAHNNTIGSPGNLIAYNLTDGVLVGGPLTVGNSIYGNMIFSNANLGINLEPTSIYTGTVTTNDLGDADIGGNNLQNFPVLNPITNSGGNTVISGTLNSTANRSFYIDLYRNNSADPSGYGEGEIYIGFASIATDGSGNASFTYNLSGTFPNQYFTATATDGSTGDTSEFSQAAQAATGRFVFLTNNLSVNENAGTVFITVNRVGGSYGAASVKAFPVNGTANELDFTFGGATMNFTDGQTSGGFNIAIIDDTADEPDENFLLQLSSPVGATIGFPGNMTVNILDNDPPVISVPDTHVVEGNSGNRDVVLNFNLSSTSALPVSVDFVTADGTATSADHQTYSASVSFSPGQTNRVITLSGAVIGDTVQEPNETFFINLSNPINATLARTQAVVTIIDDDPLPTLNIAPITNNSVRLTWTTNAWGFLLESNATLSASWNTVSNPPVVTGTNFAVTNLMGSNAFYRLHFP